MGSAQLDTLAYEEAAPVSPSATPDHAPSSTQAGTQSSANLLRLQVAERLAAHRQRRGAGHDAASAPVEDRRPRRNPIAAAVAERYAQTPSYRAILAEQAQRATKEATRAAEQAAAEAEIAARNANAIAEAQQQLLAELERWNAPQHFTPETAEVLEAAPAPTPRPAQRRAQAPQPRPEPSTPVKEISAAGLTVRLYEDIGLTTRALPASTHPTTALPHDLEEALALDEEIAFRQSPTFEPFVIEPTTPLPANLLEFPRQLIAARKARPRLAEGPLRDEPTARSPQLRIFEVEPEQISTTPTPLSVTPEWASIRLDAHTITEPVADPNAALLPSLLPPDTAPLSLRLMAATVDLTLVAGAFVAFVAVAVHFAQAVPTGIPAAIASAATLVIFYLLFQLLFFTLSDQTPGMRYARIGLCTLTDENPSRSAMRRRILAQIVATCPLGIGLLWALLDDDGLGWHDRISRMYQRAY